jgi:glycosyltransferase involved in cell wall biosynthesis
MKNSNNNSFPLVSIVTPSYNSMPYMKATIDSVVIQNYPNIEHIIIDGGSTDGTIDVLKTYPKINWVSEQDNGQSHALNKGFNLAKGEIIGWLNSDDTYEPNVVSESVSYLLENEDVDILGSHVNIIDDNDKIIGVSLTEPYNLIKLLNNNVIKQPTVFMRRRVIDELKGVNEELHYVMDWEFWLRAGLSGFKIHSQLDTIGANFRFVKGTKSYEQASKFSLEWHEVLTTLLRHNRTSNLTEKIINKALNDNMSRIFFQKMLDSIDSKDRISMLKYLIKSIKLNKSIITNIGSLKLIINCFLFLKGSKDKKFKKTLSI